MILVCRCIQDMPAVELPAREQVKRCGEQTYPGRTSYWVEKQVAWRHARPQQGQQDPQRERIAEDDARMRRRQWNHSRVCNGDGQRRNREEKSHHGSRQAYIEERFAIADRGSDADERAEGSDQRWRGNKIGIASRNTVIAAGKVVAQFMRQQNAEQRESERNSGEKKSWMRKQRSVHREEAIDVG